MSYARVQIWWYQVRSQIRASRKTLLAVLFFGYLGMYLVWFFGFASDPQKKGLRHFHEEWIAVLAIYTLFVAPGIQLLIERTSAEMKAERLRREQKERVKILNGFAPRSSWSRLLGTANIYDSIIEVLRNGRNALAPMDARAPRERVLAVKLLLCSPALDYPREDPNWSYGKWGEEFRNVLSAIIGDPRITLDLAYLPDYGFAGHNHLDEFIGVLTSYCVRGKRAEVKKAFTQVRERTLKIIDHVKSLDFSPRTVANVPFQIAIVLGRDIKEVVISFAGREIIEDGRAIPKGFRSSDPYVVETFATIYDDYVRDLRRTPFVPIHTEHVIDQHKQTQGDCWIRNYMNMGFDLLVKPGVFSPHLGNSTKFTSLVLSKVVKGGQSVLDVGSGTGVLAIVSALGGAGRVVATEFNLAALDNLRENVRIVEEMGLVERGRIIVREANLFGDLGNERFDIVAADLPFVDARADIELERAFFDEDHSLHKQLLSQGRAHLRGGGRLYTSFSTLSGPEDVARFERMILEEGWSLPMKYTFYEEGFGWCVYELSPEPINWWDELNVRHVDDKT